MKSSTCSFLKERKRIISLTAFVMTHWNYKELCSVAQSLPSSRSLALGWAVNSLGLAYLYVWLVP